MGNSPAGNHRRSAADNVYDSNPQPDPNDNSTVSNETADTGYDAPELKAVTEKKWAKKRKQGKDKGPQPAPAAFKLPKGWQGKCKKNRPWCKGLIEKAVKRKATEQLFEGKAPPALSKGTLARIKKGCSKRRFGPVRRKQCVALRTLQTQLTVHLSQRSGQLARDAGGLSTGAIAGITVVGVLLLLGALSFTFFLGTKSINGKKAGATGTGGKSSSKPPKSGRLKSKSSKVKSKAAKSAINSKGGKSKVSKISRHKSSKKSTKKSMQCRSTKTAKSKK